MEVIHGADGGKSLIVKVIPPKSQIVGVSYSQICNCGSNLLRGWWQILITGAIYSQIYSQIPKKERHSRRTGGRQAENRTSKGCQQEGRRTAGNRRSRGEEREREKEE